MTNSHINIASDIAQMAVDLDDYRGALPDHLRFNAITCVREMHKFAQELLGEDAGVIYNQEDAPAIATIAAQAEPEKLSKHELLEKCHEQHLTLIAQDETIQALCAKLSAMCKTAHELGLQQHTLVDSFDANDQEAIAVQLRTLSDRRKSFMKPKVH
jgi:hypothetical protein